MGMGMDRGMREWHEVMKDRCKEILMSHGYSVNSTDGVRMFREYNREKFALGMVDLVGMKGGKIEIVVEIEEDDTPKSILGDVSVVEMSNLCLIRTGSDSKMVPLEGAILFIITQLVEEERAKRQSQSMAMMLRDTYSLSNLSDFIITNEAEFEEELNEVELYMV